MPLRQQKGKKEENKVMISMKRMQGQWLGRAEAGLCH